MTEINFTLPEKFNPRERFTAVMDKEGEGWPKGTVKVFDKGEQIFEYKRNYSFMKTFEPFRQCRNGKWTNYALISTRYTRFEVLNLDTREIIAVLPYPIITQEIQDRFLSSDKTDEQRAKTIDRWPVDKEYSGWGFCPVEFYVPDWWDGNEDGSVAATFRTEKWNNYAHLGSRDDLITGEFGLYTGCVWGDDSSWKLRYIDLSKISEGIVTADERFGYFDFYGPLEDLMRSIEYMDSDSMQVRMPMEVSVSLKTGKVYYEDGVNWRKDD